MWKIVKRLQSDENGATIIEYALFSGIISVVIISSLISFSQTINSVFNQIANKL